MILLTLDYVLYLISIIYFMITQWTKQIFVRKKHNIVWHLVSLQMTLCQRVCLQRHSHVCCHFFEKKYVVTRVLVDRNVLLKR